MFTTQTILTLLVATFLVVLNIVATLAVTRSLSLKTSKKTMQLAMIWALPFVGAILCIAVHRADNAPYEPPKPQDFYDPGTQG